MDFKTEGRVIDRAKPEWGPGKVLHAENGIALVRFDSGAVRKLGVQFLEPCPPAGGRAVPGVRNSPDATRESSTMEAGGDEGPGDAGALIGRALAMLKAMEGMPGGAAAASGRGQDTGSARGK